MRYFKGRDQWMGHLMAGKFLTKALCSRFQILHSLFDSFPLGSGARLGIKGNKTTLFR